MVTPHDIFREIKFDHFVKTVLNVYQSHMKNQHERKEKMSKDVYFIFNFFIILICY